LWVGPGLTGLFLPRWRQPTTPDTYQKFIKDWYYQEYYNTAVEAIDELNSLLPALEAYASDTHVAEVIKNARNKIAQAEANIPQAKVKFEAEPLKDQVNKTQGRLDVRSTYTLRNVSEPTREGCCVPNMFFCMHIPEIHQGLVLPGVLQ
jgi:hypothetical protein